MAANALALARKVNLIEALSEELGRCVVDDETAATMGEAEIRAAFASAAASAAPPPPSAPPPPPPDPLTLPPEPEPAAFRAWFPRAAKTAASSSGQDHRRPLVLCFPPAGCGEDVYTTGTTTTTTDNPLLEWSRTFKGGGADVLAAQPPGRGARLREPAPATLRDYARQVAPLVARRVALAPWWAVVGHSMGAWAAVEVARAVALALEEGGATTTIKPPALLAVSAMPPPDWPLERRPWARQRDLDDAQFAEECRAWDVSAAVFEPDMWRLFSPALRADFKLFDEYPEQEGKEDALASTAVARGGGNGGAGEVVAAWGARDRRISRDMVLAWRAWAAHGGGGVRFTEVEVDGHHLWPLERRQRKGVGGGGGAAGEGAAAEDPRAAWLAAIVAALQRAAERC